MRLLGSGRRHGVDPDPFDPALVVVAESCDDAEACSAVLDRSADGEPAWVPSASAVSRFHLFLPSQSADAAVSVAQEAGYRRLDPARMPGAPAARACPGGGSGGGDGESVVLARVEVLDALHLAQERARMAGLAQRWGGRVRGWDALQPGPADPGSAVGGSSVC